MRLPRDAFGVYRLQRSGIVPMVLKQRAETLSLVDADTSGTSLTKSRKSEWIYERSAHGNVSPVDSLWTCGLLSMRCLDYAQAKANLYECKFDYKMAVDSVPTVLIYSHTDDSVWWISCYALSLSSSLRPPFHIALQGSLRPPPCSVHTGISHCTFWRLFHSRMEWPALFRQRLYANDVCWIKGGNMLKAS